MAVPLLPLAIAALVAGTGAQYAGNRRRAKATARNYEWFANRARERSAEANERFEGQLDLQREDPNAQVEAVADDKVGRVEDLIDETSQYFDTSLPGQDRAPQIVQAEAARSLGDELARSRAKLEALARIEGYGQRSFDRGTELNRELPYFENIGIFARGDRDVLGAKLAASQNKGAGMRTLGDLLVAAGQMGLMANGGLMKTIPTPDGSTAALAQGGRQLNRMPQYGVRVG